ncbi:hypothetical protein MSAR_47300 [Mycolicibacterium sarraceniae]|uniref:Uncharacterized protein n=2 Tax=Mycolicibacterium sarraceniae TaxID=1534348 RepID=A0A7I7SX45_9MYCO|nr:hypothetical protein MSAR_47300 [Mycolicibacterium sarraceniae]
MWGKRTETMNSRIEDGLAVLREMMPEQFDEGGAHQVVARQFADGLREQSLENVFGGLWAQSAT